MNSRRSFIWNLGAGASAALATAGARASQVPVPDIPALRVALLEEEKVLRRLHQDFEQAMDQSRYDDALQLFADDAEVVFNGGLFRRRDQGISRLFRERFRDGQTGGRMEAAPGFELGAAQQQDNVTVSSDLRSATAVFPYSIQAGRPLDGESSLIDMARLHGGGVQTWWEGGIYRVSYVKNDTGRWMIGRLQYDTLSRADFRPGRSWAEPVSIPRLAMRHPRDPQGPDVLV